MTIMMTLLAIATWCVIWWILNQYLRQTPALTTGFFTLDRLSFYWIIALLLHATSLVLVITRRDGAILDFNATASLVMWLTSLLLLLAQLKRPLHTLGLFVIPLTIVGLLIQLIPNHANETIMLSNGLGLHIITSLLGYSMLTLAAFQAILLALQNHHLHNHSKSALIRTLPPLLDMEALLFQLILVGIILLSLGLLTGFFYLQNLFGQHIAHKTILSLVAWAIFTILLVGHWRYGWRGKIAVRWTLTGAAFLMIGFLGSKFVIDYLVVRS